MTGIPYEMTSSDDIECHKRTPFEKILQFADAFEYELEDEVHAFLPGLRGKLEAEKMPVVPAFRKTGKFARRVVHRLRAQDGGVRSDGILGGQLDLCFVVGILLNLGILLVREQDREGIEGRRAHVVAVLRLQGEPHHKEPRVDGVVTEIVAFFLMHDDCAEQGDLLDILQHIL